MLVVEFQRKFRETTGLFWWGLKGTLPPPLVVGILVITPGPVVLVVLTGWIKGGNMNTRIRSLFSSHLMPGERQSLHLLLFDLMWNQMPENLKKFFYRQGSGHIFLLQG